MVSLLEEPINKTENSESASSSENNTGDETTATQSQSQQTVSTKTQTQTDTNTNSDSDSTTDLDTSTSTQKHKLHYWYIVALALMARLWFNFGTEHPNAFAAADASEYLRYADALAKVISGHAGCPMDECLKEFVITGPALPVFMLMATALTGQPFDPTNSDILLAAQSIVSALTAGLIYFIALRLFNHKTALYAGIIAALYPAFIVNSGRLYSETFGTFIECLAVFFIVRGFFPVKRVLLTNFFLGAAVVVGELTRSAMVLLTSVSLPFVFLQGLLSSQRPNSDLISSDSISSSSMNSGSLDSGSISSGSLSSVSISSVSINSRLRQLNWRQGCLGLALTLAGMAVVLTPWFIFEKAAYNKMTLAVDRVGHYNLFVGTNTTTQGFLSYPYPDGRGIEEKSFLTLIAHSFKQSPSRFIKLAMDKPARLFKAPWNDFRCPIGPFDYKLQVAFHQAVLLLAIVGILLGCIIDPKPEQELSDSEKQNSDNQDPDAQTIVKIPERQNSDGLSLDAQGSDRKNLDEKRLQQAKMWGRAILLLTFALNLPYLAFITVPRYNLTAMPFLIIFAAAGLSIIIYLLKAQPLAKAPKALVIFALFLFIFLRDDLKDAFSLGQEPTASIVLVQGGDLVTKGIISAAFGVALFVSIYFCISFLAGYKKLARVSTVIFALLVLPLLAVPQRANGRPGESILTLERPGETIIGVVPVPREAPPKTTPAIQPEWYLLIDSEDATILSGKLDLIINGQKINGPLIPGISALDDWHYLKVRPNGQAYLECAWIYDCMTRPSSMTNLDLRQWLYLPLPQSVVDEAKRRGCLNVTLRHKERGQTKLFGAALGTDSATIPSRSLYSWEKAFYGVENDSGLTDSRYDEKVPLRQAKWKMNFDKTSEDLEHFDLNLRLLEVKSGRQADANKTAHETSAHETTVHGTKAHGISPNETTTQDIPDTGTTAPEITTQGIKDVSLPLSERMVKAAPLTLVRATLSYGPNYKPEHQYDIKIKESRPELSLEWLDNKGKKITQSLPWLKRTPNILDVAIPCDLSKIEGSHLTLKAHYIDPDCQIKLGARAIAAHPIFGDCTLF
jgi:hypothetical protein